MNRRFALSAKAVELAVPGMPPSSPGMDVPGRADPHDVFLIAPNGQESVHAHYPKQRSSLMKPFSALAAAAVFLAATGMATAQTQAAQTNQAAAAASAPSGSMADGEVRKVDKGAGKVTLRHGPLENLKMPGMTMVFRVADPKMLDTLKEGDKVKFSADRVNGAFTVTAIEAVK